MSVLLSTECGWIISHSQYINEIYKRVNNDKTLCSLDFNKTIFSINSQFLRNNQYEKLDKGLFKCEVNQSRKRKRSYKLSQKDLDQINHVKEAFTRMQSCAAVNNIFKCSIICDNNKAARATSDHFYSETSNDRLNHFHGSNESDTPIITVIENENYVFPNTCSFYSYDVREIDERLNNSQYDFILIDPPWWNKFIRRRKEKSVESSYKMMYNEEISKIPISNLLSPNGTVAVWCTNAPSHLNSIINEMFPSWNVTYAAKWYWVKVTQSGNPICDFNITNGKQPYESLIFGCKKYDEETSKIPDKKLIVSVPSAVHSHKPPIADLMKPFLCDTPKCLEIFARYLLPGWTSWGYEVLKFQHLSLYTIIERITNNDDDDKTINDS